MHDVALPPSAAPGPGHGPASERVRVQMADFDVTQETQALTQADPRVGAVCSFLGTVRGLHMAQVGQGEHAPPVCALELEHYPGMTERSIEAIIDAAHQRFDIIRAHVVHRVGPLALGEQIVWVGVSAAHRGQSFAACEFVMDYLKTQAPFWKKEHHTNGQAHWVDARSSDDTALARWGVQAPTNTP